ncbi:hypothetical protein [Gaopeijia maritima]|uniref:Fibronectin type-III domain-containing protein n=1 Tax=Gaopeijia maritima TaxID=3119007 RepID=A0ABU9ECJ0_9BACT
MLPDPRRPVPTSSARSPRPLLRSMHGLGMLGLTALAACGDGGVDPEPFVGAIQGTVAAEGQALSDVRVGLEHADGRADRFQVTDTRGAFRFEGLDEGDYRVYLGAVPDHVVSAPTDRTLTLRGPASEREVEFSMRYRRDASIIIRAEVEGSALAELGVTIDGPEMRLTRTDSLGLATFEGLLHGRYTVTLTDFDPARTAFETTQATVETGDQLQVALSFSGIEVPRVPEAPGEFGLDALDGTHVRLHWIDRADNEASIEIGRRPAGSDAWTPIATLEADLVEWIDASAPSASELEYRLRVCNEHGCSEPWREASVTTPEVPPAPPLDPVAAATGASAVVLDWTDGSPNETRFEIERRTGTSGIWGSVGNVGANVTRWYDGAVTGGTEYGYRLRACNGVGCSPWTDAVQVVTVVVPPAPPTGLRAVAPRHDRVELSWTDRSPDETAFRVRRREGSGSWVDLNTLGAGTTAMIDAAVTGSSTYAYRVVACNSAGCSDAAETASVTTPEPPPNLRIEAAYIVQRVQRRAGDVPLVAHADGLLRVFVVGDRPGMPAPPVDVELFRDGAPILTSRIDAPAATLPTAVDESSLGSSWNLALPGALLHGSLSLRVTADPDDTQAEHDETDNVFPASGAPGALDLRTPPPFDVVFVPVRQSANGAVGSVSAGSMDSFLTDTRRMLPLGAVAGTMHAEFVTDQPVLGSDGSSWSAVLSEVAALRAAEGDGRAYYGVVSTAYGSGVAGIGYIGWPVALGWDRGSRASVAAHEWGHNFGRRHAPGCGAGNPDGAWPYANGRVGAWGWDAAAGTLKSPDVHYDLMSYCGPEWISDYVYERILDARDAGSGAPAAAPGAPVDGLLVWGRIEAGRTILEPAFRVEAPASVLPRVGRYRVEGHDSDGLAFSFAFDPVPVADAPDAPAHFAFVVPLDAARQAGLERLVVTDGVARAARTPPPATVSGSTRVEADLVQLGDGSAEVRWDSTRRPMALIRDAATGQILSFGRGGRVRLSGSPAEVVIHLSNGVGTAEVRTLRR